MQHLFQIDKSSNRSSREWISLFAATGYPQSFLMLRLRSLVRLSSASRLCLSTAASSASVPKVDKEALKELRKRTGYSYVNCRKALLHFGPERLEEAEKWLRELAAKEGWAKAAKLSNRKTKNGLVSVMADGHTAAVVEVNCETDFVARGDDFKNLVEEVTLSALAASKEYAATSSASGDCFVVKSKEYELLKSTRSGRTLKEMLTSVIGKLGENITISKMQLIIADPGVSLFGYAHPKEGTGHVGMGRFVSVVGLTRPRAGTFPIEKLGLQICQHIVGMRTETLGPPVVEERDNAKTEQEKSEHDEGDDAVQTTQIDESETRLLQQAFMLNPSQTVHEYVSGHGAKVIDFFRAEIGDYADKDNA
ncbi:Elongation factor Ts, mitochondrial [Toxocara canis]|uniref:Elongation factor Ts, mitochondrial n=1 Tax=Toxocara canis TaxID=6265 RepID=A0A0B2V4X5_TOXCA|nr:Elongation factor Ts, mitochondrial [Toxocara canis]